MSKGTIALVILLGILALGQLTCHQALLTAPPGSSITLIANPEFIAANGGVSLISAFILEPAGTPVPDGTVIQFFTNLGRIPEQGKTNDGVARVNFVSDSRSGTATIRAFSGGGAGAPAPAPTASPTTPPSGGGTTSASVTVTIGNLNAKSVLLTADPPTVTLNGHSYLTANVFDDFGNPVQGAPVFFEIDPGAGRITGADSLDSGGSARFTDNDGRAFDVLRVRRTVAGSITVKASVPAGGSSLIDDEVVITIR